MDFGLVKLAHELLKTIWNSIKYIVNLLKSFVCKKCRGQGKIKCGCIDIDVSKSYSFKNTSEYIWSCSPSIENNGWPRNIKIQFTMYFKHTGKMLERKYAAINLPGYKTKHITDLIEIKLGKLKKLEKKLDRPLKSLDFKPELELVNLNPVKKCENCKGTGLINCPKCKGWRISFKK